MLELSKIEIMIMITIAVRKWAWSRDYAIVIIIMGMIMIVIMKSYNCAIIIMQSFEIMSNAVFTLWISLLIGYLMF